jgi:hypothetical protein
MSNFKIKTEYIDKTVRVYDRILGQRSIVVAKIDISKVKYYQSIGLSYLFEEVPTVIKYEAVEPPIPAESVSTDFLESVINDKPKMKRKKKPAADA